MAKSALKGITVEIGAETKGFSAAIKELNTEARNLAKDLQNVEKSLKLNPGDIESVHSKLKLLGEIAGNSAKRVSSIEQAIDKLNAQYEAGQNRQELYNQGLEELNQALKDGKIDQENYNRTLKELEDTYLKGNISQKDYETALKRLTRELESANYEYNRAADELEAYEKQTVNIKDATDKVAVAQKNAAGNVREFVDKMSDIKDEADSISKNLKIVDERLKLDPKNVELVKQKMGLLEDACANASKKVDTIKKAIDDLNNEYDDKSSDEYRRRLKELNDQLETAQNEYKLAEDRLDNYNDELKENKSAADEAGKSTKILGDIIKGDLISGAVKAGLKAVWDLAKGIARALVDAAKELGKFAIGSVELAAQYHDAVETSKRAFREFADDAIAFAEENSVALGLYKGDMLEAMNTLGLMFASMGLGREEALNMSEQLVILAADIRAAFGGNMGEILDALQRGFSTSTRNLRQFGVYVSEAEIKAYALSNGIIQVTVDQDKLNAATIKVEKAQKNLAETMAKHAEGSLEVRDAEQKLAEAEKNLEEVMEGKADTMTSAERQVALLGLTQERLNDINGQAAAEADKYPALIDRIKAALKNAREEIGERLLPVAEELLKNFLEFIKSERGKEIIDSIADAFGRLGEKILEMTQDGTLQEIINTVIEKAPEIVAGLEKIIEKVIELSPKVFELTERILGLFGIETEAEKSRQALYDHRKEIEELAKSYDTDTDTIITAIHAFAEENDTTFAEVVSNMGTYSFGLTQYLDGLKKSYQDDTNNMWIAISEFAKNNNTTQSEILSNWSEWEPQIRTWLETTGADYKTSFDQGIESLQAFAEENGLSLDEVLKAWNDKDPEIVLKYNDFVTQTTSMKDAVVQEVSKLGPEVQEGIDTGIANVNKSSWDNFWRGLKETAQNTWQFISNLLNPDTYTDPNAARNAHNAQLGIPGYASGGLTEAGRMIRVNDDAGHRPELFVPSVPGYILNGNQTDRIVNNNNSRTVGDVNVYVNSYGMDLATVSDELGYALQQKLRMSGATL